MQVVCNLVKNSVEAGTTHIEVDLVLAQSETNFPGFKSMKLPGSDGEKPISESQLTLGCIEVVDNGHGIDKVDLSHLHQRYFTSKSETILNMYHQD